MMRRILNPTKALRTVRKTGFLLAERLRDIGEERAQRLRDGADGWDVLTIACHLRDYEIAFAERVELVLAEDNPTFVSFDHEALIERNNYAGQQLAAVRADLAARRAVFVARLEGLSDEQWLRQGVHPEQGPGTLLEIVVNVGLHDIDHLEQLARCAEV